MFDDSNFFVEILDKKNIFSGNHSINKMINISSQQVYQSYQKPLMIFGKERDKVFKQIKQDNHSKKFKKTQKIEDI
jgi:hypothetical protein